MTDDQFKALWLTGVTVDEAALRAHMSKTAAWNRSRRLGLKSNDVPKGKKRSPEMAAKCRSLRLGGLGYHAIAKRLRTSSSVVYRYCNGG